MLVGAGGTVIVAILMAAVLIRPALLTALLPLALSVSMLYVLWTHGAARAAARRTEVARSFAGMVVLHHGESFRVADQPLLGEHPTRREAARAGIDRGGWALIVHAWDRYYLLSCTPNGKVQHPAPVSFRTRAVADVVPAIHDEVA